MGFKISFSLKFRIIIIIAIFFFFYVSQTMETWPRFFSRGKRRNKPIDLVKADEICPLCAELG